MNFICHTLKFNDCYHTNVSLFLLDDCSALECKTDSGADPNKPCVFPFKFRNTTYNCCTFDASPENKAWCSTKVDQAGNHIGGQGNWGYCEEKCQP